MGYFLSSLSLGELQEHQIYDSETHRVHDTIKAASFAVRKMEQCRHLRYIQDWTPQRKLKFGKPEDNSHSKKQKTTKLQKITKTAKKGNEIRVV